MGKHRIRTLAIACLLAGCATSLEVSEVGLEGNPPLPPIRPGGIVLNKRATYDVTTTILPSSSRPLVVKSRQKLVGVDQFELLQVDIARQPFADGKLDLELNGAQQVKKLTINSATGVPDAISAAAEATDAKLSFEAEEKSPEEDGEDGEE